MYPLVETIKIFNGIPHNLIWHQKRYEHSYKSIFGKSSKLSIERVIYVPDDFKSGTVKARFLYNKKDFNVEFQNYTPVPVASLKLIAADEIDYSFKFTDRNCIMTKFADRGECDDILMVKKGIVTDTSIANIVFFDGEKWFTPEFPLLNGTARERLLSERRIFIKDIHANDLSQYSHFRLINSMLEFDEQVMIEISAIKD
jgi:4-amino-4-deoxychorismate lyase